MPDARAAGATGDAELGQLHGELLAALGRADDSPTVPPDALVTGLRLHPLRARLRELLAARLAGAARPTGAAGVALAEPRLGLLLQLYRELLGELGVQPCCVLVLRDPAEMMPVVDERATAVWLRDMLAAEVHSRGCPRVVVSAVALRSDWRAELRRAVAALELPAPPVTSDPAGDRGVEQAFAGVLDASAGSDVPIAHPWLADAVEAFEALVRSADDVRAQATLDALRERLQLAAALLPSPRIADRAVPLRDLLGIPMRRIADLEARLDGRDNDLAAARAGLAEAAAHLAAARAEHAHARERLAEFTARATAAELRASELEARCAKADAVAARLDELARHNAWLEFAYAQTRSSLSWRLTAPVRFAVDAARATAERARRVRRLLTRQRVLAAWRLVRTGRLREAWLRARSVAVQEAGSLRAQPGPGGFRPPAKRDPYELHCEYDRLTDRRRERLVARLRATDALPTIAVLVPVYEPPREFLSRAVETVRAQVYDAWELVLCDDASPSPDVVPLLESLAARDARIRVVRRAANGGIAAATNTAAAAATSDLLVFLDQDDELTPDALAEIALAASARDVDVVYSDDDKIDEHGRRFAPQFKPDWSPELLLSFSYFSHVFAVRRELFDAVGGVRSGFDGAQDYDLMLRVSERARRVAHVPRVLYHWRALPGSTASGGREKPKSLEAGRRAVADALARRGVDVPVRIAPWADAIDCGVYEPVFPDSGPRVAIVIPSRDRVDLLGACVASIERRTRYADFDIVLIDNGSEDPETLRYFARSPHRVLRIENPRAGADGFSYAAVNNRAVEQIDAELVLFLNNDTEVRNDAWLSQMVGWLGLPGVGAVGARLSLPDGRVQHAGIVHGLYEGMAGPAFKLQPDWDGGHLSLARVARNCSAVTAAALLMRRDTFVGLAGFDEEDFAVAYNDVDLCYRLGSTTGLRIVYCPNAELAHVEGGSRGHGSDHPSEEATFRERYWQRRDPYYNPNLSLDDERFAVRGCALPEDAGRPIRAAMVGFNLNAEGSSNSQFELTLGLRDRGVIEPVVVSPEDGPLRAEYERAGIEVVIVEHPLLGVHDTAFLGERLGAFASRLHGLGAEVVYANTMQTFFAILAARRIGVPAIWNVRESEGWRNYFDFLAEPLRQVALGAFEAAYAVVFVAGPTRAGCAELDSKGSFRLIRNGLDPARTAARLTGASRADVRAELGFDAGDVVLLTLGTVCERKGQVEAVEAFGLVPDDCARRARLLLVGDRPSAYSDALHAAIRRLPAARRARVYVVGERPDVGGYYRAADAFVLTSRVESYPRVILEAMFVGLPIVATPVFGVRQQVREGVNALLYPAGEPARLAEAVQRIVADDALRGRMARQSPAVLRALPGFDQMVSRYADVFREAWVTGGDGPVGGEH